MMDSQYGKPDHHQRQQRRQQQRRRRMIHVTLYNPHPSDTSRYDHDFPIKIKIQPRQQLKGIPWNKANDGQEGATSGFRQEHRSHQHQEQREKDDCNHTEELFVVGKEDRHRKTAMASKNRRRDEKDTQQPDLS
jgi:hypothetical protein